MADSWMTRCSQATAGSPPSTWEQRPGCPGQRLPSAPPEGGEDPVAVWATVAIVAMWVAVLFVGVYGGDLTFRSVDSSYTTIPSEVFVALFAAIGTGSVAKRVLGRRAE